MSNVKGRKKAKELNKVARKLMDILNKAMEEQDDAKVAQACQMIDEFLKLKRKK